MTTARGPRRRRTDALPARPSREGHGLLERLLDTPHLAHAVPRLPPEVLHRIILTCGLEDCGALVALATPEQVARVLDLDLWRSERPGFDEELDADRFGLWLEVLLESGATAAAHTVASMDTDLVTAALAQHVSVFDVASASPFMTLDRDLAGGRPPGDGPRCEVGGYLVEARRSSSWDAIAALLIALDADDPGCFHQVMRGCRKLSDSIPEIDGLDDLLPGREQDMFDLASAREQRRERRGYVAPAQARAFLQIARELRLGDPAPPPSPLAGAYFRSVDSTPPAETPRNVPAVGPAIADVLDVLLQAGVLTPQPRALLGGGSGDGVRRFALLHDSLDRARARSPAAYAKRAEEFGYLANTIMSGCSLQARPFTESEASDAAAASCNLGLQNWPRRWRLDTEPADDVDDLLVRHDLISVFQVGWKILHDQVSMRAAQRLVEVLAEVTSADQETASGLQALRVELTAHLRAGTPWRARDALDVMAILDLPAWAALLGLIDECPVLHAGIGASRRAGTLAFAGSAFEFISENGQIGSIRTFLASLPAIVGLRA